MASRNFLHILLLLLSLSSSSLQQYSKYVVNGNYYGTPVAVSNPLPTLIYNCNALPSICNNVANFFAQNLPTFPNGIGGTATFHYDKGALSGTTKKRTDYRRDQTCPKSGPFKWQTGHTCPEGNQPQVTVNGVSWQPTILTAANGAEFVNEIADAAGTGRSGLAFTCDEFPAASWIEGGEGLTGIDPPSFTTYCAPQRLSCFGTSWNSVIARIPGYPSNVNEQDWQGRSHNALGQYASDTGASVMQFSFTTTAVPIATAAFVVRPPYNGNALSTSTVLAN